jgi:hypothetical protein
LWRRKLAHLESEHTEKQGEAGTKSSSSATSGARQRWVVVLRVTLLVLAAGVAVLGVLLGQRRDRAAAPGGGQYVCPMHLEVTAGAPRECPICRMALVKRSELKIEGVADGEEDAIAASSLLSNAASGVARTLVGFNPSPARRHVQRQESLAPAWMESAGVVAALVYDDLLPSFGPREHATFYPTSLPNSGQDAWRTAEPPAKWDGSMSIVQFALAEGAQGRAGAAGWLKLDPKARESLVVPAMSVLQSSEGPYVLVFNAARGTATKRAVAIGKVFSGMAAVLSGLSPRELVVSMNAFFWDAERKLSADQRTPSGAIP